MPHKLLNHPLFLSASTAFLLCGSWYITPFFSLIAWVPLLHLCAISVQKKLRIASGVWIYFSLLLWNAGTTWWVWLASPPGSIAAMMLNACFMLVPWLFYRHLLIYSEKFVPYMPSVGLVCFWVGYEFLHLNWEFTWPWLVLGNVFAFAHYAVQWYEYTGHLGGTVYILLANILIYRYILQRAFIRRLWISLAWIAIPFFLSLLRYFSYQESGKSQEIVVVQPNIDPYTEKFPNSPNFIPFEKQLERLMHLSTSKLTNETKILAWPETALPVGFEELLIEDQAYLKMIRSFLKQYPNVLLITGSDTYTIYGGLFDATPTARYGEGVGYYDYFNTALAIENHRKTRFYHKSKLVPGVENMPYAYYLKFLDYFVIDLGGITGSLGTQKERAVFDSKNGTSVAPVICYESVFGEFVTDYIKKGAGYICIITNDGWWGKTPGHVQHLHYAQLRAIETRRAIARAANTGISGFINQRGDIILKNTYGVPDALRCSLAQNDYLTWYTRYGDYVGWLSTLGCVGILCYLCFHLTVNVIHKLKKP